MQHCTTHVLRYFHCVVQFSIIRSATCRPHLADHICNGVARVVLKNMAHATIIQYTDIPTHHFESRECVWVMDSTCTAMPSYNTSGGRPLISFECVFSLCNASGSCSRNLEETLAGFSDNDCADCLSKDNDIVTLELLREQRANVSLKDRVLGSILVVGGGFCAAVYKQSRKASGQRRIATSCLFGRCHLPTMLS